MHFSHHYRWRAPLHVCNCRPHAPTTDRGQSFIINIFISPRHFRSSSRALTEARIHTHTHTDVNHPSETSFNNLIKHTSYFRHGMPGAPSPPLTVRQKFPYFPESDKNVAPVSRCRACTTPLQGISWPPEKRYINFIINNALVCCSHPTSPPRYGTISPNTATTMTMAEECKEFIRENNFSAR